CGPSLESMATPKFLNSGGRAQFLTILGKNPMCAALSPSPLKIQTDVLLKCSSTCAMSARYEEVSGVYLLTGLQRLGHHRQRWHVHYQDCLPSYARVGRSVVVTVSSERTLMSGRGARATELSAR